MEHELFSFLPGKPQNYNLTKEEWQVLKNLKEDIFIIIKPADKESCVVLWDREDYLAEGYKQLSDKSIYVNVKHSNGKTYLILLRKVATFLNG